MLVRSQGAQHPPGQSDPGLGAIGLPHPPPRKKVSPAGEPGMVPAPRAQRTVFISLSEGARPTRKHSLPSLDQPACTATQVLYRKSRPPPTPDANATRDPPTSDPPFRQPLTHAFPASSPRASAPSSALYLVLTLPTRPQPPLLSPDLTHPTYVRIIDTTSPRTLAVLRFLSPPAADTSHPSIIGINASPNTRGQTPPYLSHPPFSHKSTLHVVRIDPGLCFIAACTGATGLPVLPDDFIDGDTHHDNPIIIIIIQRVHSGECRPHINITCSRIGGAGTFLINVMSVDLLRAVLV
ncbi:hypothetical protein BD779DRAFT_1680853 [Infundibulicybe gibba]|nr:hypothetical protein BD779DRAFT_1680853 [Infundibulicybe gibba]